MAPIGSETKVKIQGPIESDSPLEISGPNLRFDGQDKSILTESEAEVGIGATQNVESGSEILLNLTLRNSRGNGEETTSLARPIAVKAMKRRDLNVKTWIVRYDDGQLPDLNPTAKNISDYLNGIFGPQINVYFNCGIETVSIPGGWDTGTTANYGGLAGNNSILPGNKDLDVSTSMTSVEMDNITRYYKNAAADINLYIMGGVYLIRGNTWIPASGTMHRLDAGGIAMLGNRTCWVKGMGNSSPVELLDTIAHEIGHQIIGPGHPNSDVVGGNSNHYGPAPLPGTNMTLRLMCEGGKKKFKDGRARNIVKGEWDEAEDRLSNIFGKP